MPASQQQQDLITQRRQKVAERMKVRLAAGVPKSQAVAALALDFNVTTSTIWDDLRHIDNNQKEEPQP